MSGYQPDPNDSTKSIPVGLPSSSLSRAITPAETVVVKSANHVIINQTGSYSFAYSCAEELGASRDGTIAHYWEQAAVYDINNSAGVQFSPTKLDISPCAWSGSGTMVGATGDVTFVYKGV